MNINTAFQEKCFNNSNNRVYINPNFNRQPKIDPLRSNNKVMYINPNFSHALKSSNNNVQHIDHTRSRIYINPNFIQLKNEHEVNDRLEPLSMNTSSNYSRPEELNFVQPQKLNHTNTEAPTISQSRYCLVRQKQNTTMKTPDVTQTLTSTVTVNKSRLIMQHNNQINAQVPTMSKSRYSLVRQKENATIKTPTVTSFSTSTIRVHKYKSISLNTVKKDLAANATIIAEQLSNKLKQRQSAKISTNLPTRSSKFKFIKSNSLAATRNVSQTKQRFVNNGSIPRTKKKVLKLSLKKNNIPCPLFKKYGKCIRKVDGQCDFLHDKKHVSICRKFLKGTCHDANCLLSHDLTDKKMPTCYFYLQGICTKECCPYLHVKLSEKIKVCEDFLKGYCDKGDKCLFRHISADTSVNNHSRKLIHSNLRNKRSVHSVKSKSKRKYNESVNKVNKDQLKGNEVREAKETGSEVRYFIKTAETNSVEKFDTIKPTRCKLGALPSFIQL